MNLGNRFNQHSFAEVPQANIPRSKFDRSFASKDTMDFDELTPIMVDEVLPGDTINLNMKMFARLAPQVVPIMDNLYLDIFFFYVPHRLVWTNWEKLNGAQDNPADSISYTIPTITVNTGSGYSVGTVYDHMGLPTEIDDITHSALPLRAYYLIWNKWFRDENLQNSLTVATGDGPDLSTAYAIQKRGKRHDYFTSCLPWPQKTGAVQISLGTSAPVYGQTLNNSTGAQVWQYWNSTDGAAQTGSLRRTAGAGTIDTTGAGWTGSNNADTQIKLSLGTAAQYATMGSEYVAPYADLTAASASTVNQLRQAVLTQSLLELDARGGTRYVEILKAHFGVISPDFRLQRPEFLSMGRVYIQQHPVAQTSQTSGSNYLGLLAAFSTASELGNQIGFSKSFTEHGFIIGLACAQADITYQQGLNRMWSRSTRYDHFWPGLQQMGEQSVLNQEIYAAGSGAGTDTSVFGYQERYAEYRYKPSEIKGQFRSTFATSLEQWHLSEEFGSLPALNSTFIVNNTPIERSLVVAASYPHLLVDMWFDYKHARPMMVKGIPASLGRF